MKCTHCGSDLPHDARFCPVCASPVQAPPTPDPLPAENRPAQELPVQQYPKAPRGKRRQKPVKPKGKRALWISIVALILVVAICGSTILIVTRVSAKEIQQAKDNYLPPAKAVSVDLTKDDPSNDQIQFKYDDRARIVSCTYKVNDKEYDQAYTYDDEEKSLDIVTSYKNKKIFNKNIPYSRVTSRGKFEVVDDYIVRLDADGTAADRKDESADSSASSAEAPASASSATAPTAAAPTAAAPTTAAPTTVAVTDDYKQLYIDFLSSTSLKYDDGSLIYLNDDNVPELLIVQRTSASIPAKYHVCWINGGKVEHESITPQEGDVFKERSGYIVARTAHVRYFVCRNYLFTGHSLSMEHEVSTSVDVTTKETTYSVDGQAVSEENYKAVAIDTQGWDNIPKGTAKSALPEYIRSFG